MKRYQEHKKDMHMIFKNLEKMYDKILKNIMWWVLKRNILRKYLILIKNIYANIVTCVKTCDGESGIFSIKIGLHQV
jgi:hypothetical protein